MNRIEQAIARRSLLISGRTFMEVYGADPNGIVAQEVDKEILSNEYIHLLDKMSASNEKFREAMQSVAVTQVNSRGEMPPIPFSDKVSNSLRS